LQLVARKVDQAEATTTEDFANGIALEDVAVLQRQSARHRVSWIVVNQRQAKKTQNTV
jgi:hypothetical protein